MLRPGMLSTNARFTSLPAYSILTCYPQSTTTNTARARGASSRMRKTKRLRMPIVVSFALKHSLSSRAGSPIFLNPLPASTYPLQALLPHDLPTHSFLPYIHQSDAGSVFAAASFAISFVVVLIGSVSSTALVWPAILLHLGVGVGRIDRH